MLQHSHISFAILLRILEKNTKVKGLTVLNVSHDHLTDAAVHGFLFLQFQNTVLQHTSEHCLMGIKGTVRRATDGTVSLLDTLLEPWAIRVIVIFN